MTGPLGGRLTCHPLINFEIDEEGDLDVSIMNKASSCIHDVFITLLDNNDDRDIN